MLHTISSLRLIISAILFSFMFSSPLISEDNNGDSSKKNIVTIAVESGKFNTLAKALIETGLVDALKSEGPFTVFAPTDEAFAKLPKGTIESLLKDKEALKKILLYHVVSGTVTSTEVMKLKKAKTLEGKNVKIQITDGAVTINNSKVITADVMASNGVIHIIDTVLIPEH